MKKFVLLAGACIVLAAAAAPAAEHAMKTESGWFDLESCEFCKNLLKDPELLHHMSWESHPIAAGMVQITTVDPHHRKAYVDANKAMQVLGNDMMNGKVNPMQVKMCGSCAAFGQLLMAGAKMEMVEAAAADVALVTSDDPALAAKIRDYAERNTEEMKLMMASGGSEHPQGK